MVMDAAPLRKVGTSYGLAITWVLQQTRSSLCSAARQAPRFPSCGRPGRRTWLGHLRDNFKPIRGGSPSPAGLAILGSAGARNTTPSGRQVVEVQDVLNNNFEIRWSKAL